MSAGPSRVDLDAVIAASTTLAPPPLVALRVAALVAEEDWEIEAVESVISRDPALTGRLLRVANSAAYGAASSISTVREAVLRMGAGSVAAIAIAAGTRVHLDRPMPVYGDKGGGLWRHSVSALLAVEGIGRFCRLRVPPAASTAALLHDLGRLVLSQHLRLDDHRLVERAWREGCLSIGAGEREILGVDHAELGSLVTEGWRLPKAVSEGIRLHHTPWDAWPEYSEMCTAVYVAERAASRVVPCFGEDGQAPADDGFLEDATQGRGNYDRLCGWIEEALDQVIASFAG